MESRTIGADEVAEALGMSRAYAYKLIRRLNKEMEERGCMGEGDSDVGDKG